MNPIIFSLVITFEILLSCFIVWGIYNEGKLIDFENQIIKKIVKAAKK